MSFPYVNGLYQRERREDEFYAHREWRRKHLGVLAKMGSEGVAQRHRESEKIEEKIWQFLALKKYRGLSVVKRNDPKIVRRFLSEYFQ